MNSSNVQNSVGTVDVIVIGAGHAGLAISYHLSQRGIDHIVLERGQVANSWRQERWDSLRLLTPNWMTKLPGSEYTGMDPDDYMDIKGLINHLTAYSLSINAPIYEHTNVTSVSAIGYGYKVETNHGVWCAKAVVVASGACNQPRIPAMSDTIPTCVEQLTAFNYKNPDQLDEGGVLIVGASASGLQLAEEIHQSNRPVTLAIGEHVRLPRLYRGHDIQWWMSTIGLMDERLETVDDIIRVRNLPSPQLLGSTERRNLDLNRLSELGVQLVGRIAGVRNNKVQFSGSLRNVCKLADLKMNRLLDSIDEWIEAYGYTTQSELQTRPEPTFVPNSPVMHKELGCGGIRTVLWATGYKPNYTWLNVPVLDRKGSIRHFGGIVDSPGMYIMGLPFLRRRKSSFIFGCDDDARELSAHLASYLDSVYKSRSTLCQLQNSPKTASTRGLSMVSI